MQKKNWFVRVLVILLILFIASIIVTSYCFSSNRFIITGQIICLICILVILALAEIFDNFSIGNLITLSRQYDPIMERNVIFDAYYKEPWDEEVFVEMCMSYSSPSMLDRFYHLLSKVYHYRTVKKLRAKLVLIVPVISETNAVDLSLGGRGTSKERFFKYFAPAIKNNLLEIVELDVSDADIEKIKKEI